MSPDPDKPRKAGGFEALARIFKIGREIAPAQTAIAVGALVIFSVAISLIRQEAPLFSVIVLGAVVLILGVVAALVSKWVLSVRARRSSLPQVIAWMFVGLFVIVCGLIVSSIFFSVPEAGALFIARQLNAPEFLKIQDRAPVVLHADAFLSTLPASLRSEVEGDEVTRTAALIKLPALHIENAVLRMTPEEKRTVSTSQLWLSDAKIVTNGGTLKINALQIIGDNGAIVSFEHAEQPQAGKPGASVGTVTLRVSRSIEGTIAVDLSGQAGAPGQAGPDGGKGATGLPGDNAASGLFDCSRGPGRGRDGWPGQPGFGGSPGFDGGDGGTLVIETKLAHATDHFPFVSQGGAGGPGGAGGHGGSGGDGGPGGSSNGLCKGTGPSGSQGPRGVDGPPGPSGHPGRSGRVVIQTVGE